MKGIFVIGTDTGVGKTLVCAGLLKIAQELKPAVYWKPVQTGVLRGDDTAEVRSLAAADSSCIVNPAFRFPETLSPYKAAEKWGKKIDLETLMATVHNETESGKFMILEGAGGVLVPYDKHLFQREFIKATGFPVILVGRDKVGVINQALLTLSALQESKIPCLGVILTQSIGNSGNGEAISELSQTEILLELLPKEDKRVSVVEVERSEKLRKLIGAPVRIV